MARSSLRICLLLASLSCAVIQQNTKVSMLSDAGFKIVAANTPEKIQALNTLPPGKIARIDRNGVIYYVYPDAGDCRCLRVGKQEQYDLYRKMASSRNADILETTGASTQSETFKGYDPW